MDFKSGRAKQIHIFIYLSYTTTKAENKYWHKVCPITELKNHSLLTKKVLYTGVCGNLEIKTFTYMEVINRTLPTWNLVWLEFCVRMVILKEVRLAAARSFGSSWGADLYKLDG